ncbi:fluoride efflux transporter FluC [Paractinoplanes brasiliensis]|uniref:Fluoride-specific ion channel FluC n=1 Tax=Paractinoplanes brasiliensis TaxID=52695 RepID=A0A4R6JZW8_9ACTN|nr:CrcB family protein [Actinoplanes brasiliensis]TDO41987.1 protein CrcB [Actinoplanes brasiliensis]GID29732.1 putative fluoride ion transporter CrcB 1 [Actinoplanes brasiliensis]
MSERVPAPMDADVDLHVPAVRTQLRQSPWPVLASISAGGVCGAWSRYGLGLLWPHPAGGFPWATFVINVSGCLLIGVLMVIVSEVLPGRRLLRPFVGVGVLGGYTTFSTYVVDAHKAVAAGVPQLGLLYLAVTVVGALLAVWAGTVTMSGLVRWRSARVGER